VYARTGDIPIVIAVGNGTTVSALYSAKGISNPNLIRLGPWLNPRGPGTTEHLVITTWLNRIRSAYTL
jgi:hypothetical protein